MHGVPIQLEVFTQAKILYHQIVGNKKNNVFSNFPILTEW